MEKPRLLIVEDERIVAEDLKQRLSSAGYNVLDVINTGEEAIRQAEKLKPDLVLMDIVLKGKIDGIDAADQILSDYDIPVVYLSAYVDQKRIERAKKTKPYGYLVKPFEDNELRAIIEMALYKYNLEQKVNESEEKYRGLFENSTEFIYTLDLKGNFTNVNSAAERLTGYSKAELIGMNFRDYTTKDTYKKLSLTFGRIIKTGKPLQDFPIEVIIKDGTRKHFEISVSPLKKGREIIGFHGSSRNITERKKAEEQILLANERLQYLLTSTSAIIYTATASDDYGATFISDHITQMVGYEPREFLKDSSFWLNHVHPEDMPQVLIEVSRIFEMEHYAYEYRFRCKTGTYIWIRDEMKLVRDKNGKPVEIIGFWIDITKSKQVEEALKESEARYRSLIEGTHDMIQSVDPDDRFVFVNRAWLETMGYSVDELSNMTLFDIIHPDSLSHCQALFKRVIHGESITGIKASFVTKKGKRIFVEGNAGPRFLGDKIIGTQGFFRNITDRRTSD